MRVRKASHPRASLPLLCLVLAFAAMPLAATPQSPTPEDVTTPLEQFGHNIGDDYFLANYQQLTEYWENLARESDRMIVEDVGTTAEGRTMIMATITSPENQRNLPRYKEIARRMALAEGVSEAEARALAKEGKAVVWIDGGLHATEVLGAQQLMEMVFQMVSRNDEETLRFLDDVIVLATCVNPDGLDYVADWYMRTPEPTERSTRGLPRLYHKYVGHDNNRDFYMSAMPETEIINRLLYREWFPQIVYNHHQTGPAGAVMFAPPFRGPFNFNIDPLLILGIDTVGTAMHSRLVREDKPGTTMRHGAGYSTWWNGGLRTTPYWHNMIGLLTETSGHPTPIEIPFILRRQLPSNDLPLPIAPQETWHFRQSIEYEITANRAVLDIASRLREDFLFNIWRMGTNSIERGSTDTWTRSPERIKAVETAIAAGGQAEDPGGSRGDTRVPVALYEEAFLAPNARDPRGYIIPVDQPDFLTATKFINTLIKNGVDVHRATRDFSVAGKSYPAGSYVVMTAQAFRPHVIDMFEPQVHPDDIPYPGGPPTPPYDVAGWTLAFQMGVEFDRALDGFDGPFEKLPDLISPPAGRVTNASGAAGFLYSPEVNDSFRATNRLLAAGDQVVRFTRPVDVAGIVYPAGAFFVTAGNGTLDRLRDLSGEVGLDFVGTSSRPTGHAVELHPVRIGLWDRFGGDMPSGWTRWLLEQFEFPFELVFSQELDAGNLASKFDVLVFMGSGIPGSGGGGFSRGGPIDESSVPEEYQHMLGSVTADKTIPQLRQFVEEGGTIIAIGRSAQNLSQQLSLPVQNALVERDPAGPETPLGRDKFYVPGSLLEVQIDNQNPLAWGMGETADVFFRGSPVFQLPPNAGSQGVQAVAWFGSEPLRSGWAWGQTFLENGVAAALAEVGEGNVVLFGPEVNFRAQPHGTFKLLFNAIYLVSPAGTGGAAH